jgi:hypothetical protein
VTCKRCKSRWEWDEPYTVTRLLNHAISLLQSGTAAGIEQGKAVLRNLYENREWIGKNLWRGVKIASLIATIIALPGDVAQAGERLRELLD